MSMRERAAVPALLASAAVGVWLLAAPDLLGLAGGARLGHQILGPIIAAMAVIATEPAVRLLVRVNIPLGAWFVGAPLLFDHGGWWFESVVAGVAVVVLALVPVGQGERFGGGWAALFRR
ncbi:MAG: hypothetical protein M3N29_03740 [Chloroflexota bacterium]|nr:hypothetical protein [Chloroflexota bacterium]